MFYNNITININNKINQSGQIESRTRTNEKTTNTNIAIARQIFQNKVFFFTSWGSFPYKKEKKKFL
jgi:hypothetical protein